MFTFAQTNIQLFQQLHALKYSKYDVIECHKSYRLASSLFTGYFRADGKTFIAHLVGTASILASVGRPITVVNAGLLHAAYLQGNFGDERRGINDRKKKILLEQVGPEVEKYIADYTGLKWTDANIINLADNFSRLNSLEKEVLLIRLVNELEDLLDSGIIYCANFPRRLQYIKSNSQRIIGLLNALNYPGLAAEFTRVLEQTYAAEIMPELVSPYNDSFLLPPLSYKQKFPVYIRDKFISVRRSLKSSLKSRLHYLKKFR